MKTKKLIYWISSSVLPIIAAILCDLLFDYSQNQDLLFYLVGLILLITNISLFLNALSRKIAVPLIISLCSSVLIMTGQFYYYSIWHVSFGIFGLFLSAILNIVHTPIPPDIKKT